LASAHGIVYKIEVAGQTFESPLIGSQWRQWTLLQHVLRLRRHESHQYTSIDLSQGNTISFYWESGYSTSNWPHNTGPIFLYMAKCDSDCTSQTASSTNFIKIEQQGFVNGAWAQAALNSGSPVSFTIPSDIASGNYLIRHEVINLASTDENFPACSQFAITGGSNTYSSAQTAQFPGAYSASDAGLSDAGSAIYSVKSNAEYTFPGPDPVISSDGSSSGSSSASGSSVSSSSDAASSSSSAATATTATATSSTSLALPTSVRLASTSVTVAGTGTTTSESAATTTAVSSTSSSDADTCATQWTTCNAVYMSATASASASNNLTSRAAYDCQTEYVNCVAQAESSSASASTPSVSARAFTKHMRRHRAGVSRLDFH
ncbi:glycosyl hydrolase family 61-domain-containing protein, partial [Lentinula aciculospora]